MYVYVNQKCRGLLQLSRMFREFSPRTGWQFAPVRFSGISDKHLEYFILVKKRKAPSQDVRHENEESCETVAFERNYF